MTKTNAGSPKGRESYGDGVPIVVAGVTTCQGRRESRLQGEGEQVTGHQRQKGMRNAERQTVLGVLRECHGVSHQRAGCREIWHVRFGGGPYGKGPANCGNLAVRPTQPSPV